MRRTMVILAASLIGALGLGACGYSSNDPLASGSSSPTGSSGAVGAGGKSIVVGSADFSESVLLAEIYAGALRAKGVDASTKPNIGSREIYLRALTDNSVQVVPEYTGALAFYYDKGFAKTDPDEVYAALPGLLPKDVVVLAKSAAEDNDSMVVTKETAAAKSLKTVADLAPVAGGLTLAAPAEFKVRPQGVAGLAKTYGVTFKAFLPVKGAAVVQALKNGQADVANIFSTDPAIAANGFVVLEDPKRLFGAQNVVPLVRADRAAEVKAALDAVSAKLTTAVLSELLVKTDIDKLDIKDVAAAFLKDHGLG